MSNYLPDLIDGALNIIFAGVFVVAFFISKYPKLHKKKWLLLGAICFFALGGNGIYKSAKAYLNQKIPTKTEVEASISKGEVAVSDFIYSSTDGFKVLMPAGFTYSTPGGAISVAAVKNLDQDTTVAFIVMKLTDTKSLDQIIDDILQLKANGKTYYFDKGQQGQNIRKGVVSIDKDGVLGKAAIALIKRGSAIYQIMLTTKESHFENIEPLFQKILNSFDAG